MRAYLAAVLMTLAICGTSWADQSPTVLITAPANVTGNGTRDTPYVFSLGSKGDLRLATATEKVSWLLADAPEETEVLPGGTRLWFPTDAPGLYLAVAAWIDGDKPGAALCWFEVKGPNGPPQPVNQIAAKLKAALIGPDAKADAARLSGMAGGLADAVEAGKFPTYREMLAAWKAAQSATQWPAGKYPAIPDVIRLAIPTADETTAVDASNKPSIISNLRLIEKTAGAISNG